jgi:hypothetical protein
LRAILLNDLLSNIAAIAVASSSWGSKLGGKGGGRIPVRAYSNCESVELFLNGKSLGRKERKDSMNLLWLVAYELGILEGHKGRQVFLIKGRSNCRYSCKKKLHLRFSPLK